MSPSRSITGVRIRTVRPSSSVRVTGLTSLVGQPCQLPVFLALAGSELTGWSIRRKSGTAPSSFSVAMCSPNRISYLSRWVRSRATLRGAERRSNLDRASIGTARLLRCARNDDNLLSLRRGLVAASLGGGIGLGEIVLAEAIEPRPAIEDFPGQLGSDAGVGQHPGRDVGEARVKMREIGRHTDIVGPTQELGHRADLALAALDRREAVALPV